MKSKALSTGLLRLMTSAIDALELLVVKTLFYSNSNTTSNSTDITQRVSFRCYFFKIVEWIFGFKYSIKPLTKTPNSELNQDYLSTNILENFSN